MDKHPLSDQPQRPLNIDWEDDWILYPESVAEEFEMLHKHYQRTEQGLWLLAAFETAAIWRVPPPQWCRRALQSSIEKWHNGEVREFGEAIGITRPKRWRQYDHRHRMGSVDGLPKYYRVFEAVKAAHEQGKSLSLAGDENKSAFVYAAKKYGVMPKTAETWYYEEKQRQQRIREIRSRKAKTSKTD